MGITDRTGGGVEGREDGSMGVGVTVAEAGVVRAADVVGVSVTVAKTDVVSAADVVGIGVTVTDADVVGAGIGVAVDGGRGAVRTGAPVMFTISGTEPLGVSKPPKSTAVVLVSAAPVHSVPLRGITILCKGCDTSGLSHESHMSSVPETTIKK